MVRLVIKAPNQKIDDCEVRAQLSWTVAQLKEHLSCQYPSRPAPGDQRLIYSGHLMRDEQTLSQVFRGSSSASVEEPVADSTGDADEDTVTLHLVCRHIQSQAAPTSTSSPSAASNHASGPAGISTAGPSGSSQAGNTGPASPAASSTATTTATAAATFPLFASMMQQQPHLVWTPEQLALAHQLYQQFMNQLQSNPAAAAAIVSTPFPHLTPLPSPLTMASAAAVANAAPAAAGPIHVPLVTGTPAAAADAAAAAAPPAAAILNNNVIPNQAAVPPVVDDDEDDVDPEDRDERDFLGWFYWLSRAVVLFSVVYFYSSLARFAVVLLCAILMYLYQIGLFQPLPRIGGLDDGGAFFDENRVPAENEGPAAAGGGDPAAGPADQEQDRQLYQQQQGPANGPAPGAAAAGAPQNQRQHQQQQDPAVAAAAADGPRRRGSADESQSGDRVTERSGLRMLWLIVSSLFTSLIPEQPPAHFN